jgi:hypothetical protein
MHIWATGFVTHRRLFSIPVLLGPKFTHTHTHTHTHVGYTCLVGSDIHTHMQLSHWVRHSHTHMCIHVLLVRQSHTHTRVYMSYWSDSQTHTHTSTCTCSTGPIFTHTCIHVSFSPTFTHRLHVYMPHWVRHSHTYVYMFHLVQHLHIGYMYTCLIESDIHTHIHLSHWVNTHVDCTCFNGSHTRVDVTLRPAFTCTCVHTSHWARHSHKHCLWAEHRFTLNNTSATTDRPMVHPSISRNYYYRFHTARSSHSAPDRQSLMQGCEYNAAYFESTLWTFIYLFTLYLRSCQQLRIYSAE